MKYISRILVILMVLGATACYQDNLLHQNQDNALPVGVFGDQMRINLNVTAPDPFVAGTKAVDPDGKTLQTLHVFCFDANGLFLTTAKADVKGSGEDNLSGTFSVSIPKTTRIIHLLANQNMSIFDEEEYIYRTEDDVLSALEGSAGMLIYWARIEAPINLKELYTDAEYDKEISERTEAEAFVDWITIETNPVGAKHRGISGKGHPIILLRNQAKFTIVSEGNGSDVNDEWKGDYFEVTGFVLCNIPAFGTVAPYSTQFGFPTYSCSTFTPNFGVAGNEVKDEETLPNWLDANEVTSASRNEKMSDIADVTSQREYYVFESNNLGTDPVDLILKGRNIKNGTPETERYYYRVNIIDEEGELVKVLRNHHYEIHIDGNLSNGCLTFDEALQAPPTNNIWISISDEVNSVRNNNYVLTVEKTDEIVEANAETGMPEHGKDELKLYFNITALHPADKPVDPDKISVYWMEDDQKVSGTYNPSLVLGRNVTYDAVTGDGTITLSMNKLLEGSSYERGSLVVKYGHLQRKIRIILLRTNKFIPTWVSSEVYRQGAESTSSRANVTVVFTVPETCPEEMFPMDVLITTNSLDGRASTGQILPVLRIGEDGYGREFETTAPDGTVVTDLGYKYKLTVTEPGQHRIYFQNIINRDDNEVEYVTLEASYFDFLTKMVTYADHKRNIVLPKLSSYSANQGAKEEEYIKYILVPRKRYAPVVFDVALEETDGTAYATLTNEEFLLYSTNLDHYEDDEVRLGLNKGDSDYEGKFVTTDFGRSDFDCYFKPYSKMLWNTGGRIFGFYPREDKVNMEGFWSTYTDANNKQYNCFQIYMETNKPNSEEVVRIASNQVGSASVITDRFTYMGNTFRSTTFELANYRPFRFAAQIKVGDADFSGNYVSDDSQISEVVDDIEFAYLPEEIVAVSFDVTSFNVGDVNVNPFGTAFEIFIDAPMLKVEKGMNRTMDSFRDNFEDLTVKMFEKDADGVGRFIEKPKFEDLGNGRFVYRVHALDNYESHCWKNTRPLIFNENKQESEQLGARKTFYFKKNSVVSNGEITISANPDHVTYYSKTFKVSNTPIEGIITYKTSSEATPRAVPAEQFVSFARESDGSRIGSLTVVSDGSYMLRLRAEYSFDWENDPMIVMCSIDGKYYSAKIRDLKSLYNNTGIVLELGTE